MNRVAKGAADAPGRRRRTGVRGLIAAMIAACTGVTAQAAILVTGDGFSYSESFDSLANTGTIVNALGGAGSVNVWTNDLTLPGWSLFVQPAIGNPVVGYAGNNGSATQGGFYSYGPSSTSSLSTERALGGLGSGGTFFGAPPSGVVAGWIAASFANTSGQTLSGFSVGYDGEQWRNGGNASAQTMVLEYGFGASFGSVSTWTAPGGAFDWISVVNTATAAAVDGNAAGLVAGRGGSVTGLNWASGDTLWLRWIERNDTGNDHGLAIDNFSFTAAGAPVAPVPLPAAGWLLLTGLMGLIGIARRR